MAIKLNNFIGVELFAAGTWTDSKGVKRKWTTKDLDDIVAAYEETKDDVHAPIKLGHNDAQKLFTDDAPAAGWVENLRRVGNKLVGDFMRVPETLAKLIEEGAYRARSAELSPDFEVKGKKYSWLFTGVALLGSRLPAVSGLNDIVALYERQEIEYDATKEVVFFESEGDDDELETLLEDVLAQINNRFKGKRGAPHIRALETALKHAITGAKGRANNEMDRDKLIKLMGLDEKATDEQIEAAIKKLQTEDKPKEHSSDDSEVTALRADLASARGEILELQKVNAVAAAEKLVDDAVKSGKLLPKQREFALNFAKSDEEGFKKYIENMPEIVKFGEDGTRDTNINFSKYEPTQAQIDVAKQMNLWNADYRLDLMRQNAARDGVELPVDFGKEKAAS